jgi:hypothetical protein
MALQRGGCSGRDDLLLRLFKQRPAPDLAAPSRMEKPTNRCALAMRGHRSIVKPTNGTAPKLCLPANKMREAERRQAHTHYSPRHIDKRYRLPTLRARRAPRMHGVAAAMRFGRARLSALRRGTRQVFRPGSAPGCASTAVERLAPTPDASQRAPRIPVVVPGWQGPKPPGSGVCGSARRRRIPLRLQEHPRERRPSRNESPSGMRLRIRLED